MPIAYCTAVYGLLNLAQLSKGEVLLLYPPSSQENGLSSIRLFLSKQLQTM